MSQLISCPKNQMEYRGQTIASHGQANECSKRKCGHTCTANLAKKGLELEAHASLIETNAS